MGYTVADMFNLFQFSEGLAGLEICRKTGIKPQQMQFSKTNDVLTKKTNEQMVRQFGENWNSIENLRKYQEKKNIVKDFDCERMKELRGGKEGMKKDQAEQLGIGRNRLASMEKGESKPLNWKEYLKFKEFYKDDLLKVKEKKETETSRKEFITFKNVGGHWEMSKRIVRV